MTTHHAVVWMDHNEARALTLGAEGSSYRSLLHLHSHEHTHTHPKKYDGHRQPADPKLLAAVAKVIAQCDAVVVVGPSSAKDELVAHLEHVGSPHRTRVVATRTLDRMGDGELAAVARDIFRGIDRMNGIHVPADRSVS